MTRPILVTFIGLIVTSVVALLLPSLALAKRAAPAKVEPVVHQGIRYTAPNDDGYRGYIEAWDVQTNKKLWDLTIFTNRIDPKLEEDVQWVFIKTLELRDNSLRVISEISKTYWVDLKTKAVTESVLPNPSSGPSVPVTHATIEASRSVESFRFIGSTTTMQQVIAKLGAPDRDVGSGIYIYEYRLNDGTRVWIWSADSSHIGSVRHGTTSINDAEVLYPPR